MHHRIVSPRLRALLLVGLLAVLALGCATPSKATAETPAPAAPAAAPAAPAAAPAAPAAAPAVQAADPTAEDPVSEALAAYRGASPACFAVLEKALALGGQGAYRSAFAALEAFDPANADPYALAFKTELLLEGHARSLLHRSFGLKDLGPGDDLEALRRGEDPAAAALEMIAFDPPALAAAWAVKGKAAPAVLEQAIGDYYYEVLRLFEGSWLTGDKEIRERAAAAYERASAGGLASLSNSLRLAQVFIGLERFDEADRAFRAGIGFAPYDGELRLNHASFLLMREQRSEAMAAIDAALAAFAAAAEVGAADPERRFEAYVLGVRAASELGEWGRVEGYLGAAEKAFPTEPAPGLLRHYAAVESGRVPEAAAAADALLARFPRSPSVVRALVSSWLQVENDKAAAEFLDRGLARHAEDPEAAGGLRFYRAILVAQVEGPAGMGKALAILGAAEADFRKVFPPRHEVFGAIADLRGQFEEAAATVPAAGSPAAPAAPAPAKDAVDAASSASNG